MLHGARSLGLAVQRHIRPQHLHAARGISAHPGEEGGLEDSHPACHMALLGS